jgi:hypothetical protein
LVVALYDTLAATVTPLADSVNVAPVTVLESIAFENVAVTVALRATYVAPTAGARPVTVGGGGGSTVVNVQAAVVPRGVPSVACTVESMRTA